MSAIPESFDKMMELLEISSFVRKMTSGGGEETVVLYELLKESDADPQSESKRQSELFPTLFLYIYLYI